MFDIPVRKEPKGPYCRIVGSAALFLLLAGGAWGAVAAEGNGDGALAQPAWLERLDYTVEKRESWRATYDALEEKYAEGEIPVEWYSGGALEGGTDTLNSKAIDFLKVRWGRISAKQVDGKNHRVRLRGPRSGRQFVLLKAQVKLETAQDLKCFFSTNHFVDIYFQGERIYRGIGRGSARGEDREVEISFPAGPSGIMLLVELRYGNPYVYLRVGRTNAYRRQIAILRALQRLHPDEHAGVLDVQYQIAHKLLVELNNPAEAETEYRRLLVMAGDDAQRRRPALGGLAEVCHVLGRFEEELDMRLQLVELAREHTPEALQGDLQRLVVTATSIGRLQTAFVAAREHDELGGGGWNAAKPLFDTLVGFSLRKRAESLLSRFDDEKQDEKVAKEIARAQGQAAALKGDPVFLDLKFSARSAIEDTASFVSRGAYDEAAGKLLEVLDSSSDAVVPVDGGGAGVSAVVAALLRDDGRLRAAYGRLAGEAPLGGRPAEVDRVIRRPGSEEGREALEKIAARAAAEGRYDLSALAAQRALQEFPDDAAATALAAAARRASGHVEEKAVSPKPQRRWENLVEVWRAPLEVAGRYAGRGRWTRPNGSGDPAVAGAVYRDRLYWYDGARIHARELATGEEVFDALVLPPPGVRVLQRRPNAGLATMVDTAAVEAGGGAVYVTLTGFDEVAQRSYSSIVAADADTGRILWRTSVRALGAGFEFSSPPAWAHDRVYVICRRAGGVQMAFLACLDSRDGTVEFLTSLGSGPGILSCFGSWGAPRLDPAGVAPAATISGGTAFVVPNNGFMAAVDCLTGQVKSVQLYERAVVYSPNTGLASQLVRRPFGSPVVSGETAVVAPKDSVETLIIRAGKRALRMDVPGVGEVIGISGETAVCTGDFVSGVNIKTGETTWRRDGGEARALPGGVVRDGLACIATSEGLSVLEADDGRVVGRVDWGDGEARGNLLVEGDFVVAFGEKDVVVMSFPGDVEVAGQEAGDGVGEELVAAFYGGGMGGGRGLWAAAAAAETYMLGFDGFEEPCFFSDGEREMVFLPGLEGTCWEITGGPRLLWRARLGFRPTGAVYDEGRVIFYDEWTFGALDARSGELLWRHDTARLAPVEFVGVRPVGQVVPLGGRIAYLRGRHFFVMDASTGEIVFRRSFEHESLVRIVDGGDCVAVLMSSRYAGTRLWIFETDSMALRTVVHLDDKYTPYSRMIGEGGRIYYVCAHTSSFAACIDVADGVKLWKNTRVPKGGEVPGIEVRDGRLIYTTVQKGYDVRALVINIHNGEAIGNYLCRALVGVRGDVAYVVDSKGRLCKHRFGKAKQLFRVPLEFEGRRPVGLEWRLAGDFLYALVGADGTQSLSLARFSASTGKAEGQWSLPILKARAWRSGFVELRGGRVAIPAEGGVQAGTLESFCADRLVGSPSADDPVGTSVSLGKAAVAEISASNLASIVVDGDLADWSGGRWTDVSGRGGEPRSRIAFAHDGRGFLIGVRTFAGEGAIDAGKRAAGETIRVSVDSFAGSMRAVGRVHFDAFLQGKGALVTISGGKPTGGNVWQVPGVWAHSRANRLGGEDWEIAVPWRLLERSGAGTGEKAFVAAAVGGTGAAGNEAWSWPGGVAYIPAFFGRVKLERGID